MDFPGDINGGVVGVRPPDARRRVLRGDVAAQPERQLHHSGAQEQLLVQRGVRPCGLARPQRC